MLLRRPCKNCSKLFLYVQCIRHVTGQFFLCRSEPNLSTLFYDENFVLKEITCIARNFRFIVEYDFTKNLWQFLSTAQLPKTLLSYCCSPV